MNFDLISFLIGFLSAGAVAFVLFRFRERIGAVGQSAQQQVGSTRQYISTSSEGRYLRDVSRVWNHAHIGGELVELSKIYLEPRFVRPPTPPNPFATETDFEVFSVVPLIHDLPASYAPYNIPTLNVRDLQNGERHLALLGVPGLGKSTTLALIGLMATGEVPMPAINLLEDELFEAELKDLPSHEREKQIERRKQLQKRALEQLEVERKKEKKDDKPNGSPAAPRQVADFRRLLPLLVHLRDIDLRPESYGADGKTPRQLDPAEPIVKALQGQFGALTASALPGLIYRRLADGTCLVMIDGFDDLPAEMRPEKLTWLAEFLKLYGDNFVIVAGPASGFDPLLQLGLTPLYLKAWSHTDYETLVTRWAKLWTDLGRDHKVVDEQVLRRVITNLRGRSALDVTLKLWAAFAGDEQESGRRGWYDAYVRHKVPKKLQRYMLGAASVALLDKGGVPLTREEIKEIATQAFMSQTGRSMSALDDSVQQLTAPGGLLAEWGDSGRFSFDNALINAYLAAETLGQVTADVMEVYADKPAWNLALGFAAATQPLDKAVAKRLTHTPDLLYSGLFSLSAWLIDAPATAHWKGDVFRRLTAALLAPTQFPLVRERAMAMLVASRDPAVTFILVQSLSRPDPLIQRLGCVGLGAHGDPEVVKELDKVLENPSATLEVKLAAGMALGAIGNENALESMVRNFVYNDQTLRRGIAESLAAIPGEGQAVLREAITSQDMMLRHAAVFGLSRVNAAWSLALLYRALLEDEQWYVRNAATTAFTQSNDPDQSSVMRFPEADKLPWLVEWAARKGDSVPAGEKARDVLIRSLTEGEAPVRAAAATTLATLGHIRALKTLYMLLGDREESVRAAAHAALGQLQQRTGEPFPIAL